MPCLTPLTVRNKLTAESQAVPCGKCPECYKRRVSGWCFRLLQEERVSHSAYFVTLTYDTRYIPISRKGLFTLDKTDLQKFFKRLRKAHGSGHHPIKYYACGEYGEMEQRPHYHVILFNSDQEKVVSSWRDPQTGEPIGLVHFGTVEDASVAYTSGYMMKPRIERGQFDDRLAEFSLMSKGLGLSYLSGDVLAWHTNYARFTDRMYLPLKDGKKAAMPRYYKQKIYSETQRKVIAYHQMKKAADEQRKAMLEEGENYWSNLASQHRAAFKKSAYLTSRKRTKFALCVKEDQSPHNFKLRSTRQNSPAMTSAIRESRKPYRISPSLSLRSWLGTPAASPLTMEEFRSLTTNLRSMTTSL